MIKKGQIWGNDNIKYVITQVLPRRDKDGFIYKLYQAICGDGFCFDELKEEEIKQDNLIAEHPTWQEAVNSKEFMGEDK